MNHLVIAPIIVPLCAGIVLLLARHVDIRARRAFALLASLAQLVVAIGLFASVSDGAILTYSLGNWPAPYGIVLVADRLAAWMLLVTALLAPIPLLHACRGGDMAGRHFHVLYPMQLMGLNGAFLTGDLFNLFVFFEVLLLSSYGLVLHGGGRMRTETGLHYVVLNLAGSALFLISVGTLYGLFGTLNMADLALRLARVSPENLGPARAAGLLLFCVFALKAALLPLHLWLPRAYSHTSLAVAALFAIMTKVGAYCILRVASLLFGSQAGAMAGLIEPWLLPLALITLVVSLLGALAARTLREQGAYLVLASVGTLLTAFALPSPGALAAGLYYLPHSTFAAAALFLLADAIAGARGSLADHFTPGHAMPGAPILGGLFFVVAILLSGLPPLSGFIGKLLLLQGARGHETWIWIWACVLVGGLLGIVALARSGSLLFFRALPREEGEPAPPPMPTWIALLPILLLLALTMAMTVWAGPVHDHARATAEQLLRPDLYVHAVLGVVQ